MQLLPWLRVKLHKDVYWYLREINSDQSMEAAVQVASTPNKVTICNQVLN